jgi:hypothetical protein
VKSDCCTNREELFEQCLDAMQGDHVRPVTEALVGIGMNLHEESIDTDRDGGTRESSSELSLTTR